MANNRSGQRPGGGLHSKNVVSKPVRTGAPARGYGPAWVAELGQMQGNHVTPYGGSETKWRGDPMATRSPAGGNVPLGNAIAGNVGKGGPGTGRTLYGQSGTQKQYGSGGPQKPAGRDILSEFGPDKRRY